MVPESEEPVGSSVFERDGVIRDPVRREHLGQQPVRLHEIAGGWVWALRRRKVVSQLVV